MNTSNQNSRGNRQICLYLAEVTKRGAHKLRCTKWAAVVAAVYWIAVGYIALKPLPEDAVLLDRLLHPFESFALLIIAVAAFWAVIASWVVPPRAWRIAYDFRSIAMTNAFGVPPLPVSLKRNGDREELELLCFGITRGDIEEMVEPIEAALNKRVVSVVEGRDKQHILVRLAPGDAKLPEKVTLDRRSEGDMSKLRLGVSLDGEVVVDLNRTPHILVGGSTGTGKTTMLKTIIKQLLDRNDNRAVRVMLIDLKGGMDYLPDRNHTRCSFESDEGTALSGLTYVTEELRRRQIFFRDMSDRTGEPCSTLEEYNSYVDESDRLPRMVVVVDEIAQLTDTTGMEKPHKERAAAIVSELSTIARLGRAFGINLVIGTQRPDANVIPGQIKNNLDYRVCGKADATLSTIILGNGDADERIPKDSAGLFLNHEGVMFRGYMTKEGGASDA